MCFSGKNSLNFAQNKWNYWKLMMKDLPATNKKNIFSPSLEFRCMSERLAALQIKLANNYGINNIYIGAVALLQFWIIFTGKTSGYA